MKHLIYAVVFSVAFAPTFASLSARADEDDDRARERQEERLETRKREVQIKITSNKKEYSTAQRDIGKAKREAEAARAKYEKMLGEVGNNPWDQKKPKNSAELERLEADALAKEQRYEDLKNSLEGYKSEEITLRREIEEYDEKIDRLSRRKKKDEDCATCGDNKKVAPNSGKSGWEVFADVLKAATPMAIGGMGLYGSLQAFKYQDGQYNTYANINSSLGLPIAPPSNNYGGILGQALAPAGMASMFMNGYGGGGGGIFGGGIQGGVYGGGTFPVGGQAFVGGQLFVGGSSFAPYGGVGYGGAVYGGGQAFVGGQMFVGGGSYAPYGGAPYAGGVYAPYGGVAYAPYGGAPYAGGQAFVGGQVFVGGGTYAPYGGAPYAGGVYAPYGGAPYAGGAYAPYGGAPYAGGAYAPYGGASYAGGQAFVSGQVFVGGGSFAPYGVAYAPGAGFSVGGGYQGYPGGGYPGGFPGGYPGGFPGSQNQFTNPMYGMNPSCYGGLCNYNPTVSNYNNQYNSGGLGAFYQNQQQQLQAQMRTLQQQAVLSQDAQVASQALSDAQNRYSQVIGQMNGSYYTGGQVAYGGAGYSSPAITFPGYGGGVTTPTPALTGTRQ